MTSNTFTSSSRFMFGVTTDNIGSSSQNRPPLNLECVKILDFDLNEDLQDEHHQSDVSPSLPETDIVIANTNHNHSRSCFESWNFGPPTCVCTECGAIMWYEERIKKSNGKTTNPKFSLCCGNGKVQLPMYQDPPVYMKTLLQNSSNFRENIRAYNSIVAFTSTGGKVDDNINKGGGPYNYKVNGQNHHLIGSLLPDHGDDPKLLQLYVVDTEDEVNDRIRVIKKNKHLKPDIVHGLLDMIYQINPLCQTFKSAKERFRDSETVDYRIRLIGTRAKDGRQHNLPTASEIAVIIVDHDHDNPFVRDIVLEKHGGSLHRISELHPSYMALQYTLLFPHGESGYNTSITHKTFETTTRKRKKLSQREYYACYLFHRHDDGHHLLSCGRLTQQYLCDSWVTVLSERVGWAFRNQKKLRSYLLSGLEDAISEVILKVLPNEENNSTVVHYWWAGPLDLFITFTCNPKWPEVAGALTLTPDLKPEDRPDLVSRVFKIKLDQLIHDLAKGKHVCVTRGVVYTVELQKRGKHHTHIALFLEPAYCIKDTTTVDRFISAELPNEELDPVAFKAVTQFMLHGPCGNANKKCPCMENDKCSKHLPKPFQPMTTMSGDGFPVYMRRNDNITVFVKGIELDNSWGVPHNVDLVVKYDSHINVELCNQARCIKYLFKYMCKGLDRATIIIEDNSTVNESGKVTVVPVDEVDKYLTATYFSSSESTWRLLMYDVQYHSPSVERLNLHLPNEQTVTFRDDQDIRQVLNRDDVHSTMLTEWFRANNEFPQGRDLTYVDFPSKFVWIKRDKEWRPRQQGFSIGRMYFAHPSCGERYYLRILLNIVKGALSFADLLSFDGHVYGTLKEACKDRGLLQDDSEWHETLLEASVWATGHILRELFVTILLFCEVTDEYKFWTDNWKLLSKDILYAKQRIYNKPDLRLSDEQLQEYTLFEIERTMNKNGRSLREYENMPFPTSINNMNESNALINEELAYDRHALALEHHELYQKLSSDQKPIYKAVVNSALNRDGRFFFVYGSGGTGKTFLWRTISARLRSQGKIVLSVPSSGIAALLLDGGRTAHSRFKIPIKIDSTSTCLVYQGTPLAQLLRKTSLIIWDEAPMAHRHAFEAVDNMLRDILSSSDPDSHRKVFGGLTVLLGDDFCQILPVVL